VVDDPGTVTPGWPPFRGAPAELPPRDPFPVTVCVPVYWTVEPQPARRTVQSRATAGMRTSEL
jgi:hypothetical protein